LGDRCRSHRLAASAVPVRRVDRAPDPGRLGREPGQPEPATRDAGAPISLDPFCIDMKHLHQQPHYARVTVRVDPDGLVDTARRLRRPERPAGPRCEKHQAGGIKGGPETTTSNRSASPWSGPRSSDRPGPRHAAAVIVTGEEWSTDQPVQGSQRATHTRRASARSSFFFALFIRLPFFCLVFLCFSFRADAA